MFASILGPTDLAAVFAVCGVAVMALRRGKKLTLGMGKIHATLNDVSEQVRAVDVAVNERAPFAATMSQDVALARVTLGEAKTSLTQLEEYVTYQHDTNHKLINLLTPLSGLLPIFLAKLESIDRQLTDQGSR